MLICIIIFCRIPKKQSYKAHTGDDCSKISTPLAKQELPEINLKFERCKKGKDGEVEFQKEKTGKHNKKDSRKPPKQIEDLKNKTEENSLTYASYKKNKGLSDPYSNKSLDSKLKVEDVKPETTQETESITKTRYKSKRKKNAFMTEDSERLPPPPPSPPLVSKTEVDVDSPADGSPLGFDEPHDEDFEVDTSVAVDVIESVAEGCSNYTSTLNDLQSGNLAVQVVGLLRKGKTDLPALKESECPTQGTAQKCAWWFAKGTNKSDSHLSNKSPSFFHGDLGSDSSFCGYNSNSCCSADKCQVNEISSTSRADNYVVAPGGDLDKEECCVSITPSDFCFLFYCSGVLI